jgi:hypothetical protein
MASKTLVAVTSFACTVKGVEHIVRQGDNHREQPSGGEGPRGVVRADEGQGCVIRGAVTRGEVPPAGRFHPVTHGLAAI